MITEVIDILFPALSLVLTVYLVILKSRDKRLDKIEGKQDDIVTNYLDRFSDLEKNNNKRHIEVITKIDTAISDIKTEIDDRFVTKEFCEMVHKK